MTKEELEKEAEEKARELEESQTLGVYDYDEDFQYDNGWNDGEVTGFEEGYLAGSEPREKRISELKSENAELKKNIENLEGVKLAQGVALERENAINDYLREEYKILFDKLTKAKEIIKDLLDFGTYSEDDEQGEKKVRENVWKQAEQFISEQEL